MHSALRKQGERLYSHEQLLADLESGLQALHTRQSAFQDAMTDQLRALGLQTQQVLSSLGSRPPVEPAGPPVPLAPGPSPNPHPEPRVPHIERYDGDAATCRSFLSLCSLTFDLQPSSYPTERSRVAFIITNLTGRAREWATAEWDQQSVICHSVMDFSGALRRVFDHRTPGREAARELLTLRQGNSRVADYAIRFRTLAVDSQWRDPSLSDAFLGGLSEEIKDQLAPLDLPTDLEALVALATRIDNRLHERRRERRQAERGPPSSWRQFSPPPQPDLHPGSGWNRHASPSASHSGGEEPMQLGRTHLSPEERQRRQVEGRCFFCGGLGHLLAKCPAKDRAR